MSDLPPITSIELTIPWDSMYERALQFIRENNLSMITLTSPVESPAYFYCQFSTTAGGITQKVAGYGPTQKQAIVLTFMKWTTLYGPSFEMGDFYRA